MGGMRLVVGLVGGVFALALVGAFAAALLASSSPSAGPQVAQGAPTSGLAGRVNGACGRFELVDWTTGDEFDPLPPGLIQVTCSRGDGTTFVVAVER